MFSSLQDIRFGLRLLLRAPAFTIIAVASLAIGIGANAAIFGAINGLLLKPVQAAAPDRLVAIFTSDFSGPLYGGSSYPDAVDFARGAPALEDLAVADVDRVSLTIGRQPEQAYVEQVSPNYFRLLGLTGADRKVKRDTTQQACVALLDRGCELCRLGDDGDLLDEVV